MSKHLIDEQVLVLSQHQSERLTNASSYENEGLNRQEKFNLFRLAIVGSFGGFLYGFNVSIIHKITYLASKSHFIGRNYWFSIKTIN